MPGRAGSPACATPGSPSATSTRFRRAGSLAVLAGLDVHTGQVFASTPATTGIKPFWTWPARSWPARSTNAPGFAVVDNGSDHRGQAAVSRLATACPNAIMIHTPVHASWLNPIPVDRPSARRHTRAS